MSAAHEPYSQLFEGTGEGCRVPTRAVCCEFGGQGQPTNLVQLLRQRLVLPLHLTQCAPKGLHLNLRRSSRPRPPASASRALHKGTGGPARARRCRVRAGGSDEAASLGLHLPMQGNKVRVLHCRQRLRVCTKLRGCIHMQRPGVCIRKNG